MKTQDFIVVIIIIIHIHIIIIIKIYSAPISTYMENIPVGALRHGCRADEVCATQVLPMRVGPFAFRYQGNGATPCQLIPLERQLIALQLCR